MGEQEICVSNPNDAEKQGDSLCPVYFGVSCAIFALQVLSKSDIEEEKWCEMRNNIIQGSTHLLGLLAWKVQREASNGLLYKLHIAEKEIEDLKEARREDAKANEKVVAIFASQEQSWFNERRSLMQQIRVLRNALKVLDKKKEEAVSELDGKLKETELLVESKDRAIEEELQKREELEEKVRDAENEAEELRVSFKKEAQEYSSEIRKHKIAFTELLSNQRQLEAELGRGLQQVNASKRELESVLKQKEESELMAQKLSLQIGSMKKELEEKDSILAVMVRKSKLDSAEKKILLKEAKQSKAKRWEAELETERRLRTMFINNSSLGARGLLSNSCGFSHNIGNETEAFCPVNGEDSANVKHLESWLRMEGNLVEKAYRLEIEAFAEQVRAKDGKLEALQWQLLKSALESKHLQSHVEVLNKEISRLRHDNKKLEAFLFEREEELSFLKDQYESSLSENGLRINLKPSLHSSTAEHGGVWSEVNAINRKPEMHEIREASVEDNTGKEDENNSSDQFEDGKFIIQSPDKEFVKVVENYTKKVSSQMGLHGTDKLHSPNRNSNYTFSNQRLDLHALGVSYKIKRLKQQLLMLEKLRGHGEAGSYTDNNDDGKTGLKDFVSLTSLLHKQVTRYHSLQEKTDDLCKRMHENDIPENRGKSSPAKTKEKTRTLEHFLEETFQLQRYIVATGQKLMDIQPRIAPELVGITQEMQRTASIDMERFADSIKTLFQKVQRGLEVRTARIIGDLEGTLACEGMIHMNLRS